jgi:hypothetical protein
LKKVLLIPFDKLENSSTKEKGEKCKRIRQLNAHAKGEK